MAYYETINLVAGDDKPEIYLTLKDANTAASGLVLDPDDSDTWAPIDITDADVNVKFRAFGSTTLLDTLSCVKVVPFTDGICYAPWNLDTLDVDAGIYEGEIEIVYDTGRILTLFDKLKFKVRDDF
jgi:hypothetical protein